MRIHILIKSTRFTGGRQEYFRHANELARRGHQVTVWVRRNPAIPWMEMAVPVERMPRSLRSLPAADIVLFERPRLAWPACRAERGIPVHFCHGFEGLAVELRLAELSREQRWPWLRPEFWQLRARRRLIDRGYRAPAVRIVITPHLRDLIKARFGQDAFLVPNSLPEGLFSPPEQRDFTGQTLLVVGPTDTDCKRIPDALEAVRLLKHQRPGVRLVRVAQHPMRACEQALGVTDEYHTMVPKPAMAALYRSADVLIMPSNETEGFGLPALEAMACGAPVVLTDIPAFRRLADPVDYAHFVPVGAPPRLAEAIARLLDDQAERQRLSRRGLEVARLFSPKRSFDAMEAVLEEIVRGHGRRLAS